MTLATYPSERFPETVDAPVPVALAPAKVNVLPRPGLLEKSLVVLTVFIFMHETPNAWFDGGSSAVSADDSGNPILVMAILGLSGLAFVRIAGYLNLLIATFRLDKGLFCFVGICGVSIFWSADMVATMNQTILLTCVTLFAVYLFIRFPLDQFVRMLAIMFTISAVFNLAWVFVFPQFAIDPDGNWNGVLGHKNALGFVAAMSLPTLLLASRSWLYGRLIFLPAIPVNMYLLLGSQSKTMLVAGVIPFASIFLYQMLRARRTLRGAVLVAIIGNGVFGIAFATANITVLANWLNKDISLTGRVPLWQSLFELVMERPLFGYGFGAAYGGYSSPIHQVWIENPWEPSHSHNALLELWVEVGIFAAVLFFVVYFRAVWRATTVVAVVPSAVGLWPLVFLTSVMLISVSESGVVTNRLAWTMYVVALLSVSFQLKQRRDLGLSNDLRTIQQEQAEAAATAATQTREHRAVLTSELRAIP